MLGDFILLRRRQYYAWRAFGFECSERRVEERSAYALPAMLGIDDDVIKHTRRSAQRHVVVPLDAGVGITNHLAVALGDEDHDVRLIELASEKRAVTLRGS